MTRLTLLLLILAPIGLYSQEVKSIDLTNIIQRTELRFPPDPRQNDETGFGGGYGGVMVGDGASDFRDPHALGIYLESVSPHEIDPKQPFEAEFKVLNTGLAPIQVPVSPHLSDLQPLDESLEFEYLSIVLHLTLMNADPDGPEISSGGNLELYGTTDHEGTILVLKPGEWIRVKANMKLQKWPSQPMSVRIGTSFGLRRITYTPHPGGSFEKIDNLYPNQTPTGWSEPVDLIRSGSRKESTSQTSESPLN